ncbi:MAG: D-glycerate dehydrogenase [Steroidobacteraceae bacterium]
MSAKQRPQRPHLLVTRKLPPPVEERAAQGYEVRLNADDRPFTADDWRERSQGAAAILCTPTDRLTAAIIDELPRSVRIIATFSVGFEHIDLAAAAARDIVVTNTPDVLTDATADIAMLLLLGAARRAAEGEALMRRRAWPGWAPTQLLGTDLGGKTLGIVGFGRIGQAVARRAVAFGMRVHYLSRNWRDLPGVDTRHHATETTFWPACQFVSLHLPLNAATCHYLNATRIARLPRGAIVVNTARGDIVDDDALLEGLATGHLGAAGLDVYSNEPEFRREYAELPNTFLLPHLGSATLETRCAMGFRALDNLDQFFADGMPRDAVTLTKA